jgi:hypothetical protein
VGLRVFDAQGNAITFRAAPEPATLALVAAAIAAAAWRRWRAI